jgi:PhnB protein
MTPTPQIYLTFDGRCEAAFTFYEQRLGATIGLLHRYGDSPMAASVPEGWETKIMHGSITLGALTIAGADVQPGQYVESAGFRLMLEPDDPAETERLFAALSENARIEMPLQETFWAQRFGVLTDQFGIPWTLNCAQAPDGIDRQPRGSDEAH